MMETINKGYALFLHVCFIIVPFLYGMYYDFCGAAAGIILAAALLFYACAGKKLEFKWTLGMAVGILILFGYIAAVPFAVDSGMASLGAFKYLWAVLWIWGIQQMSRDVKKKMFDRIPYIGAVMCILGAAAYQIPALYENMFVNGRLGGGFQYPNTFALFLLCGLVLLCDRREMRKDQFVCTGILLWGIVLSGSRTVFVFTFVTVVILLLKNRNRCLAVLLTAGAALFILCLIVTGNTENIGRITTFSILDSTLVGRILYAVDAFPLLAKHPFGMGHMGYYYIQNMIQTGVYSVQYVHNDFLQIGLDAGWLPMIGYGLAVVLTWRTGQVSFTNKMLLAVIFFHGLLDFDLAYGAMYMIVLMIMDNVELDKKQGSREISWRYIVIPLTTVLAGCGYMISPLVHYYRDDMEQTLERYPWHTEAKLNLLSRTSSVQRAELLADEILEQNDTSALACYAKAVVAYNKADFEEVITWQNESVKRNYFDYNTYLEFAYMLYDGMMYYENLDKDMYEACKKELLKIPQELEQAEQKLSRLGLMIDDQPQLGVDRRLRKLLEECG